MEKLNFYTVEERYVKYMSQFDKRISKSYDEKARRPFIGIVLNVDGILYFAPFTSPKPKHVEMKNTIDFLKIDNGNLGAINFNNMMPISVFYRKIYFSTNRIARIYISGVIFFALPLTRLITT